jgi:hypothetical protein
LDLEYVTCDDEEDDIVDPEASSPSHEVVTLVLVLTVTVVTNEGVVSLLQEFIVSIREVELVSKVSDVSQGVELGWGPYLDVVGVELLSVGLLG